MPFSLSAHNKPGQHSPDSTIFLKYSFILPLNAISGDAIFNAVCYQQYRLRLAQQLGFGDYLPQPLQLSRIPQERIPWDSSNRVHKLIKLCSPQVQGCEPAICLIPFSQESF